MPKNIREIVIIFQASKIAKIIEAKGMCVFCVEESNEKSNNLFGSCEELMTKMGE